MLASRRAASLTWAEVLADGLVTGQSGPVGPRDVQWRSRMTP